MSIDQKAFNAIRNSELHMILDILRSIKIDLQLCHNQLVVDDDVYQRLIKFKICSLFHLREHYRWQYRFWRKR